MDTAKSYRDVIVWRKAHAWVLDVYRLTRQFPKVELYGLTSQLRRAALSVPSSIVEGFKRRSPQEKVRFLNVAESSLAEAGYQLLLAHDLGYADTESLRVASEEIDKLLNSYLRSIEQNHGLK